MTYVGHVRQGGEPGTLHGLSIKIPNTQSQTQRPNSLAFIMMRTIYVNHVCEGLADANWEKPGNRLDCAHELSTPRANFRKARPWASRQGPGATALRMEEEKEFLAERGGAEIADFEADPARMGAGPGGAQTPRPAVDQPLDQAVRALVAMVSPETGFSRAIFMYT